MFVALFCFITLSSAGKSEAPLKAPGAGEKPHIVMLLADDLGWASVGWHRPEGVPQNEINTPNLYNLVKNGIELDRAYVYWMCAPSRSSLQSGRVPMHGHMWGSDFAYDPQQGGGGMPLKMTGMAEHLKSAGYAAHFVGKWGAGWANFEQLPVSRGYDSSFGFLGNSIDPWTDEWGDFAPTSHRPQNAEKTVDRWESRGPSIFDREIPPAVAGLPRGVVGEKESDYQEFQTKQRVLRIITDHDKSKPLFLCYCFRLVHEPLYLPLRMYESVGQLNGDYKDIVYRIPVRQLYAGGVKYMDEIIGEMVDKLQYFNMWKSTLLVFMSDNGGPVFGGAHTNGGSNFPLKGGKDSPFEGGIRSVSFVSGGFLQEKAPHRVGTKLDGYVHICDWYSTFAALAGVDPTDQKAKYFNLPPIDSLNMWPYLSGADDWSPRDEVYISKGTLIKGHFKIVEDKGDGELDQGCWSGPLHPNSTYPTMTQISFRRAHGGDGPLCLRKESCSKDGCLYNIRDDPGEHHDLSESYQEKFYELRDRLDHLRKTDLYHFQHLHRLNGRKLAADTAARKWNHHIGPFTNLPSSLLALNASVVPVAPLASLLKQHFS